MRHSIISLAIAALLVFYFLSDSPSRDGFLAAAIIAAISDAADRISNRSPRG